MHINVGVLWYVGAILVALIVRWITGRWTWGLVAGAAVLVIPGLLIMLLLESEGGSGALPPQHPVVSTSPSSAG